jgi:serine/threonine protein kinase
MYTTQIDLMSVIDCAFGHHFPQIRTAMEFLSQHQIVHRDLAARNVLICARQPLTAKLADFGSGLSAGSTANPSFCHISLLLILWLSCVVSRVVQGSEEYYRARNSEDLPFRYTSLHACEWRALLVEQDVVFSLVSQAVTVYVGGWPLKLSAIESGLQCPMFGMPIH